MQTHFSCCQEMFPIAFGGYIKKEELLICVVRYHSAIKYKILLCIIVKVVTTLVELCGHSEQTKQNGNGKVIGSFSFCVGDD